MPVHPVTRSHLMPDHRYRQWNITRGKSGGLDYVYLLFTDTRYATMAEAVMADALRPAGPLTAHGTTLRDYMMHEEEGKALLKAHKATWKRQR